MPSTLTTRPRDKPVDFYHRRLVSVGVYPTSTLVMFTGPSAGSGKSTTMRAVAARLRGDARDVLSITEDDVWGDRQLGAAPVDRSSALPL